MPIMFPNFLGGYDQALEIYIGEGIGARSA